jgi:signal transduction histidine kinase
VISTAAALRVEPSLVARYRGASVVLGAACAVLGAAVLVGWALELEALKSLFPGGVSMKPNTALSFVLGGAALALGAAGGRTGRAAAVALAATVAILAAATLVEYGGPDLAIDQLLFREAAGTIGTTVPGRMAPNTAFGLLLLGAALALSWRGGGALRAARALALLALLVALIAVVGYLYGVSPLFAVGRQTAIALPTAVGIVALAAGVLLARPDVGLTALFASTGAGGALARRLVPLVVLAPFLVAIPTQVGVRLDTWDLALASAVRTVVLVALLAAVALAGARAVERHDADRRAGAERLAAREAELRQLFTHMSSAFAHHRAVFEGDRAVDYVFLAVNPAFERLVGISSGEIVGRRATQLFPWVAGSDLLARYGAVARGGAPLRFEQEVAELSRWYSISVYSPAPDHFAVVFDDVTETRRREDEIRRLNRDLARRADDLSAANRELEAFSYSVSHDLRSPLRSIDGFGQALVEDCGATLTDACKDHVRRIRAATQRMGRLIDDLLQLSRIARTELRRERVDLSALARDIAAGLARGDPERRVTFEIHDGLVASGDPALLRVALENLLGNAWKFTSKHPTGHVRVGRSASDGGATFFVSDDGAGFDMAYGAKLFGAFQRLHANAEFPGTGIGLATVQRVVRRHGGTIRGEGAVDRGATFTFTLPDGGLA